MNLYCSIQPTGSSANGSAGGSSTSATAPSRSADEGSAKITAPPRGEQPCGARPERGCPTPAVSPRIAGPASGATSAAGTTSQPACGGSSPRIHARSVSWEDPDLVEQ